jgi:hypothetical protein
MFIFRVRVDSDLFTDIHLTILLFQVKGVPRPFQMKDQPIPFRNSEYIIFLPLKKGHESRY